MIQAARGVVSIYDTVRLAGRQAANSGPALFRPGTKLLLFCEVGSPPLPSLSSQLATAEQSVQFCSGFPRLKLFFAKENASTTIIHPGRRTSITPSIRSSSTTCGFTLQVLDDVLGVSSNAISHKLGLFWNSRSKANPPDQCARAKSSAASQVQSLSV